ncbi:hypothetical protein [Desulfonema ishimotonii]|uniref:hypothetical protein n=1 Tax=Desulfonema ishimotonii TaxID=45657 RepID=UPI000F56FA65|nr:hypothetical protein [Desulfonema ishimotonii]
MLIPRLVIAVLILGELYGDFLYLKCLAKESGPFYHKTGPFGTDLLIALGKRVVLILVFCLIYYGVRYVHKKGIWPRAIISLLLLQFVISFVAAGYGAWRYKGNAVSLRKLRSAKLKVWQYFSELFQCSELSVQNSAALKETALII